MTLKHPQTHAYTLQFNKIITVFNELVSYLTAFTKQMVDADAYLIWLYYLILNPLGYYKDIWIVNW